MNTVKEVQLMDGENKVTPVVLADSIRDSDGSKFVDNLSTTLDNKSDEGHTHDDRYYTETEIDNKFRNYNSSVPSTITSYCTLSVGPLKIGDTISIKKDVTFDQGSTLEILDTNDGGVRSYLIYEHYSKMASDDHTKVDGFKTISKSVNKIFSLSNTSTSSFYHSIFAIIITRIA